MVRSVRCVSIAIVVAIVVAVASLTMGAGAAGATPAGAGALRIGQLSPTSHPLAVHLDGERVSMSTASVASTAIDPNAQANTNQILSVVRGVAVKAGSAYALETSGSVQAPVGGVATGFGGGAAHPAGYSSFVVLVLVVALLSGAGAVYVEVRRRRFVAPR